MSVVLKFKPVFKSLSSKVILFQLSRTKLKDSQKEGVKKSRSFPWFSVIFMQSKWINCHRQLRSVKQIFLLCDLLPQSLLLKSVITCEVVSLSPSPLTPKLGTQVAGDVTRPTVHTHHTTHSKNKSCTKDPIKQHNIDFLLNVKLGYFSIFLCADQGHVLYHTIFVGKANYALDCLEKYENS